MRGKEEITEESESLLETEKLLFYEGLNSFLEDLVVMSLRYFIGKGKHFFFIIYFQTPARLLESLSGIPQRNNIGFSPHKITN